MKILTGKMLSNFLLLRHLRSLIYDSVAELRHNSYKTMKYIKIIVCVFTVFLFFSCSKDEVFNPLENTIWVHEFKEEEHIVDAKAAEYHFGKDKVAYYAIGNDGKISRRLEIYSYKVNKDVLTIGHTSCTLTDETFYINGKLFVKKSK